MPRLRRHCVVAVLCFVIGVTGCSPNKTSTSQGGGTDSDSNYASLVNIGERAQSVRPIGNGADLQERKRFVESGKEMLDQLWLVLQNESTVHGEFRPRRVDSHGQDTFLHFKPLAALVRESCLQAIEEKDTPLVLRNARLLIDLGKSICYGGDSDDQTMGFIFAMQGVVLLYKYLQTQPDGLDESAAKIFEGLSDGLELGSVTVSRLPKDDDRRHKLLNAQAVAIQSNRVFVMRACLDMCRIAFELERHRMASGTYPKSLQEMECSPPLATDPWSKEPFMYRSNGNFYQMYSKGIDKEDDGGETPTNSELVTTGRGDIDISKMK